MDTTQGIDMRDRLSMQSGELEIRPVFWMLKDGKAVHRYQWRIKSNSVYMESTHSFRTEQMAKDNYRDEMLILS